LFFGVFCAISGAYSASRTRSNVSSGEAMNDKIVTVTFPKCGTCIYRQEPDAKGLGDCHGNPPQVILLGATQDALGRPAMQLETFVPKVKGDRPACALHKRKDDFATLGRS
jgi:hypothetical protein